MLSHERRGKLLCLTLEELLAGVFLKEGFVGDRPAEVVNHQLEDRMDLLFGVTRIVSEIDIL